MKRTRKRNVLQRVVLLAVSCLLIAGCNIASTKQNPAEMKASIKIMYGDEQFFHQQYGDLFKVVYPNIDVEIVSTSQLYHSADYNEGFKQLVEQERPDVVLLDTNSYEQYVNEGKLKELDSLIKRDKYDIEGIYPTLIELMKEQGGGKLYGLGPTFSGRGIFYNKDLFAKHNIQEPHDGMSWEEIFELAARFPTSGDDDTRTYGYSNDYTMTLSQMVQSIASTQGLTYANPDTMKVTVNTDSWIKAYKLAMDALESGTVYNPAQATGDVMIEDYFNNHLFLSGRAAMTVAYPYTLQSIKHAKSYIPDYKDFQIGIAAGPVDSVEPSKTRELAMNEIFAIHADSSNVDAAWEFIKYVNGPDYAKVKSKTVASGLLSRMGYSTEMDGVNVEAFYKLEPKFDPNGAARARKIPATFTNEFQALLESEISKVQEEKLTLEEALKSIEEQGQVILDRAVEEQQNSE